MTEPMRYTFHIEVGKGRGKYSNKYSFQRAKRSTAGLPFLYYNSVNIGNGYKKRLVMVDNETGKRTVIDRQAS